MNLMVPSMGKQEAQIREWLDQDVVERIQPQQDGNVFNLNVVISELNITIVQPREDGPVVIISRMTPGPEALANLIDRKADRQHLQNLLGSVFTNTPGAYNFLDENGNACEFDELYTLEVHYRIYPDGLSQHSLMNALMDITSALVFFRNSVLQFLDNLDEQS